VYHSNKCRPINAASRQTYALVVRLFQNEVLGAISPVAEALRS
jgi:hypothetical protein